MNKITGTIIEADPKLPVIRMTRDFAATPAQLLRAHTDPALFARWVGPNATATRIEHWDACTGGSWRYVSVHDGREYGFHGSFHEVRPDRIVQTFTFDGASQERHRQVAGLFTERACGTRSWDAPSPVPEAP